MSRMSSTLAFSLSCLLFAVAPAGAQFGDPAKVTLKTTPVAGGISVIEGANGFAGGNVAVSVGADGVFLIDDELQPLTPKLKAAVAALSKKPVRFVFNTHWHGDHTGGNQAMGTAGAIIVAHDNVRKRLSTDQFMEFMGQKKTIPASPPAALPVVTFSEDVSFFLNGDEVHVFHVAPAHTDGDSIVHFKKANVIHMGDTLTTSNYPIVDIGSGGNFEGFISAAEKVLPLCDDATKIIPGHGPLATRADLQGWHDMLVKLRDQIAKMVAAKKSLADIQAAKPTAEYDAKWGQGFVKPEMLVEMIYKTLPPPPAKPVGKRKP